MTREARLEEIREDIARYVITVDTNKRSRWLTHIEKRLKELVIGQDRAIEHLVRRLGIFYAGLKDPRRPIGSMIFMGPTGTGKTYAAKVLAAALLGYEGREDEAAVIIECGNLSERHSIQTLIGAPPSYIGYGDRAVLSQDNIDRAHLNQIIKTLYRDEMERLVKDISRDVGFKPREVRNVIRDVIREHHRPLSVIVLDEIEEANSSIIKLLLNIFEEGRTTLANGAVTDFSNSIFILTSNVGSQEIKKLFGTQLGFSLPHQKREDPYELDKKIYRESKRAFERDPKFSSKFIGRLRGEIIVFRSLTRDHYVGILDLMLNDIQNRLSGKDPNSPLLLVNYSSPFKRFLLEEGIDPEYGARNLRAVVERHVSNEISQAITSGQLRMGDKIVFKIECGKPVLKRKHRPRGIELPEFEAQSDEKKIDLETALAQSFGLTPPKKKSPQPVNPVPKGP